MYNYECFDSIDELINYLNKHDVHREDIVYIERTKLCWILIFITY